MSYLVSRAGKNGCPLFLVDRSVWKDRWWVSDPIDGMQFRKESVAIVQCSKLRYGDPKVINYDDACKLADDFASANYLHPHDLG